MHSRLRRRLVNAGRASLVALSVTALVGGSVRDALAMPISEERRIGDEFLEQARRQLPLINDHEVDTLVRKIGYRLVAALGVQPFQYEFFVIAEDSINAFAVPGGKVFVHAGLISRADSEQELAGVLGHEIAHAAAHHSVRQQEKSAAANYASLLGIFLTAINPMLGQAAIAAGMSQKLQYQRDFEREADFLGIGYAAEAGYDPAGILALLRKMYDEQKINPTLVPPYLLSHPLTGERLAYIESTLKKNEWQMDVHQASWAFERVQAIVRGYAQTRAQAVPPYERRLERAKTPEERGRALELIGIMMTHGDDYHLAIGYLEEAERLGRQVDRELGRSYLRKNNLAAAEPRLRAAVARDAEDWNALADLGETYYLEGRYAESVERYEQAVALFAYGPELMQQFGRALDKAGRTPEGFYWFAKAAEFRGDSTQALSYYRRASEGIDGADPRKKEIDEKIEKLEKEKSGPPQPPRIQRPERLAP
jgi:predicted Zn-dependent protease